VEFADFNLSREHPMTDDRVALIEALQKADDGNFLRSLAETVLQILMEADVEGLIGAGRYERTGERSTYRNGYRERSLDTRLGSLNLKIPKLRTGSYFPGFLEPRRTVEKALVAVIQEAWIAGVSTRRVDDLVQAMGVSGISKSSVSKLCQEIDERVLAFLKRPLLYAGHGGRPRDQSQPGLLGAASDDRTRLGRRGPVRAFRDRHRRQHLRLMAVEPRPGKRGDGLGTRPVDGPERSKPQVHSAFRPGLDWRAHERGSLTLRLDGAVQAARSAPPRSADRDLRPTLKGHPAPSGTVPVPICREPLTAWIGSDA